MKLNEVFKGTNFGTTNYEEIILGGLENVVCGYENGATLSGILENLGLIEFREGGTIVVLSHYGLSTLYEFNEKAKK